MKVDSGREHFCHPPEECQCGRGMGGWWDRKGENEIDLVCEDESQGILDFYEIKREKSRISIKDLKGKTEAFFAKNPTLKDRTVHCRGLAVEDM